MWNFRTTHEICVHTWFNVSYSHCSVLVLFCYLLQSAVIKEVEERWNKSNQLEWFTEHESFRKQMMSLRMKKKRKQVKERENKRMETSDKILFSCRNFSFCCAILSVVFFILLLFIFIFFSALLSLFLLSCVCKIWSISAFLLVLNVIVRVDVSKWVCIFVDNSNTNESFSYLWSNNKDGAAEEAFVCWYIHIVEFVWTVSNSK